MVLTRTAPFNFRLSETSGDYQNETNCTNTPSLDRGRIPTAVVIFAHPQDTSRHVTEALTLPALTTQTKYFRMKIIDRRRANRVNIVSYRLTLTVYDRH